MNVILKRNLEGGNETMIDELELLKYAPERVRKEAEDLALEIHGCKDKQIRFLLIGKNIPRPIECFWLDPYYGMFQVVGHEDAGFMMIRDLPEGSLILYQRIEPAED